MRMMLYYNHVAVSGKVELCDLIPPENVWLGVTAENQEQADKRIPVLLKIPARVRFVSVEPMLGPVDLKLASQDDQARCVGSVGNGIQYKLDWVIVGGESGPKARPMHPDWVRALRDQCQKADVPFFFKQWGEWIADDYSFVWLSGRAPKMVSVHKDTGEVFDYAYPYNCAEMMRVGTKRAGRLLDGQEWSEDPYTGSIPF
jgi:protein gp37